MGGNVVCVVEKGAKGSRKGRGERNGGDKSNEQTQSGKIATHPSLSLNLRKGRACLQHTGRWECVSQGGKQIAMSLSHWSLSEQRCVSKGCMSEGCVSQSRL